MGQLSSASSPRAAACATLDCRQMSKRANLPNSYYQNISTPDQQLARLTKVASRPQKADSSTLGF